MRRILNLLFSLHVSPRPLTTSQIANDPEIGYAANPSTSHDSRCKAFKRDRETLAGHGVHVREVQVRSASGVAVNEERAWAIDRSLTHVAGNALSLYDAREILAAIDQVFALHADDPTLWPLQTARAKLCELMGDGAGAARDQDIRPHSDLRMIWDAFGRRRAIEFTYRDAQGNERDRMLDTYGMFTHGTHSYLVGFDHEAQGLRTFRTDRIMSAKRAPESRKPYATPEEFDVAGHQFLPFDFSPSKAVPCAFSLPAGLALDEALLVTQGRGLLENRPEGWTWEIDVRDLDAAAAFALEHAYMGMRATGPDALLDRIKTHVEQAVAAHE